MTVQPESETSPARRIPVVTPARAGAAACLIVPLVSMLWVNSYARMTPAFIGIPFFYWYQISWVLITCVLTAIAYVLIRRDERDRREESGLRPLDVTGSRDEGQGGAA
jgi:hypothetical protein